MRSLNAIGDTVVEVLIAIGVASLTLVAAYTSATGSYNSSRKSQERVEALKIAQTQFEQVKAYANDTAKNVYETTNVYCYDASGAQHLFNAPTYDPLGAGVTIDNDDFSKYPSGCVQGLYHVAVKYTGPTSAGPPPSLDDYFTILVRWNRLGGQNDEIKMYYRLHP